MKPLFVLAVTLALIVPAALLRADEPKKDDKQTEDITAKVIGTWEITKAADDPLVGATVVFAKDGKLMIKLQGQEIEGTWKIEKGKLITEAGGGEDTDTFKKLTADAMELENKEGKVTVLKKKK